MGYTTEFSGTFKLNKKLDDETFKFLCRFNETRRMKFKIGREYGVDGEFFVGHHEDFDSGAQFGQVDTNFPGLIDYNKSPSTQPGLWCQWRPTEDGMGIEWDGGEKFYEYVPWIKYIITNFLEPKGYKLSGEVMWEGEERSDTGTIFIRDNVVTAVDSESELEYLRKENAQLKNSIADMILLADETEG